MPVIKRLCIFIYFYFLFYIRSEQYWDPVINEEQGQSHKTGNASLKGGILNIDLFKKWVKWIIEIKIRINCQP